MEGEEENLSVKLTQLKMTDKRTAVVIESGQREAIERHKAILKTVTARLDQLRIEVEAYKIAVKQDGDEIELWSDSVIKQMANADKCVEMTKL